MKSFFNWMDDKNFVILSILIFGIVSLVMELDGNMELIEKLAYGILGLAVGKKI